MSVSVSACVQVFMCVYMCVFLCLSCVYLCVHICECVFVRDFFELFPKNALEDIVMPVCCVAAIQLDACECICVFVCVYDVVMVSFAGNALEDTAMPVSCVDGDAAGWGGSGVGVGATTFGSVVCCKHCPHG